VARDARLALVLVEAVRLIVVARPDEIGLALGQRRGAQAFGVLDRRAAVDAAVREPRLRRERSPPAVSAAASRVATTAPRPFSFPVFRATIPVE
jgi:hypothetical protein